MTHGPNMQEPSDTRRRSGPRTPGGKARVARNAMRHGLSLPVLTDPATAAAVEALTRQISQVAPGADDDLSELAQSVAQAQVDLTRVRRLRHDLLAAALIHVAGRCPEAAVDTLPVGAVPLRLPQLAVRLAAMDRYERRALSRRKFAIRAFDAARRAALILAEQSRISRRKSVSARTMGPQAVQSTRRG